MSVIPSPNGSNGRNSRGQFTAGNAGGPGNPFARHIGQLRTALMESMTPADVEAVVHKLVDLAKEGSIPAAKELLERCLGKAESLDLLERVEVLEQRLFEAKQ